MKSVKRYHGRLYACCGSDVVVIKISDLNVEYSWNVMEGYINVVNKLNTVNSGTS